MAEELTFAEAAILHLDRAMRELAQLHSTLQVADEHLLQADQLMMNTQLPASIIVLNENVQSVGVSLVNTGEGTAVKVGSRMGEYDHLVGPGQTVTLNLNG